MDGLFPTLPKDITKMSDEDVKNLLAEHDQAVKLIMEEDADFLKGMSADEVISQLRTGKEQIIQLRGEVAEREQAAEAYQREKAEIAAELSPEPTPEEPVAEEDAEPKPDPDPEPEPEEEPQAEAEVVDPVAERVLVTASAEVEETPAEPVKPRLLRAPPAPAPERVVVTEEKSLAFVASGQVPGVPPGSEIKSRAELAEAMKEVATGLGAPTHMAGGREERYQVAKLKFADQYPEDRVLRKGDLGGNTEKIQAVGNPYLGTPGMEALVASGGFCAPLEPIYTMPQLATMARPVRDALPNFRAERGGVNVPTPTTIGDAVGAITVITADADALGGTFATKSCLDMDCPEYNEYAVTVISHCREFGNLNAMAWPEKIAHENELTMAEHARVAEGYILAQIKNLSVKVTSGAETLGALIYLVDAITKSAFGIRSRLRLPEAARFTALLPRVALDILLLDTVQTQFDRYRSRGDIEAYLNSIGIDVTWYLDTAQEVIGHPDGVSMIATGTQGNGPLGAFPDQIEWALFPQGTFLHLDMAELNLGIVRDSTLNSTNDFQIFGETFENVARIGPEQAAYWETTDICANGNFPPAGTSRTCD